MEPISALVAIIAAGATSALKDTASAAVKDAYAAVKAILKHHLGSWAGLEADPKNQETRDAVADELKQSAANDDVEVINRIKDLQAALKAEPPATLERQGVSVADIDVAGAVLMKDIKYGKYFDVKNVKASSFTMEGFSSGDTGKN